MESNQRRRAGRSGRAQPRRAMYTHGNTTRGRRKKATCYETDRRTCWASERWRSGRPRWSERREGGTTGRMADYGKEEGRRRSGRKGNGGFGPGTRERRGGTHNPPPSPAHTHHRTYLSQRNRSSIHAGSSRTFHTTGRGEARPTGCRSRTGAPCNKGVGDVGTGPN